MPLDIPDRNSEIVSVRDRVPTFAKRLSMRTTADWTADRRERARQAGFCITCCRRIPEDGRSVCRTCAKSAAERVIRRRAVQREHSRGREALIGNERAGDRSFASHLYDDASRHYCLALESPSLA